MKTVAPTMISFFGHSSLNITGSNGEGDTNPKRQRGMPQAIRGATAAPSLTLRVGMWTDIRCGNGLADAEFPGGVQREVSGFGLVSGE